MNRNHLKFEFDCPLQKAYKDDSGKMHVIAVASDDGVDLAEERISLVAQKQMAQQCTENALSLLDNHRTTFGFGKTVDGIVKRNSELQSNELLIDFELDEKYPQAQDLFEAVSAKKNDKQLSIGGFVDREQDTLETTKDGHIVRVINAIELEHIAMTRPNMACNPRTRTLSAVIKALYATADLVEKSNKDNYISSHVAVKKATVEFKSFPLVAREEETTGWTFTLDESNLVLWRGAGVIDGEAFARAANDLQTRGWELFKTAHVWWDNTLGELPPTKLAYKLPHHKIVNGRLVTFFQGVAHAMSRAMPGGFNSALIPHTERDAVVIHLAQHYAEFDVELPEKAKRFLARDLTSNDKAGVLAQWLLGATYAEHQQWLKEIGYKDLAEHIEKLRVSENEVYETRLEKGIVAFKSWPLADKEASPVEWSFTSDEKTAILYKGAGVQSGRDWSNVSEKARMRGWSLFRQAHAYIDDAYEGFPYPQNKNAYLLAHHKLEKDTLKTFFSGVAKSMASLMPGGWARRRIRSPHARRRVWRHLSGHLREFGVEPPNVKSLDSMMLEDFIEWFKDPKLTDSADAEYVLWEVRKIVELLTDEKIKISLSVDPEITNDIFDVDNLVIKRVIADESTIVPEIEPQVSRLVVRSGDGQAGMPGVLLPEPLVVWARTAEGQPAQGVRVEFTVSGNATLSTDGMETDSAGRAWVLVTLGEDVGDVVVLAESDGFGPPVSFKLMAKNEDTISDASVVNDDEDVQASADVNIDNKAVAEDAPVIEKAPVPFKKYPLEDRAASWAFSGSDGNDLLGPDGNDWTKFKAVHAWFDDSEGTVPEKKDAYKLPHHKLVDGEIKTFFRGVVAAGVALVGGRRKVDIPEKDRAAVAKHLAAHYREFDEEPPNRLQALTQRGIEDVESAKAEDVEEALTDALAQFLLTADVDIYLKWLSDNGHKDVVKEIVAEQEAEQRAELGLGDEIVAEEVVEETTDTKADSANVTVESEVAAPASDPLTDAIAALATLFGKMQTEGADDIKALLVENAAKGVNPQLLAIAAILERAKAVTRDEFSEKDLALARRLHEAFFTLLQRIGVADDPVSVDEEVIKSLQSPLSAVLKEALKTQSTALTSLLSEKLKTVETKALETVTKKLDELHKVFATRLEELESSLHGVGERVNVIETVSGASQQLTEPVTKSVPRPSKSNVFAGMFNGAISDMKRLR